MLFINRLKHLSYHFANFYINHELVHSQLSLPSVDLNVVQVGYQFVFLVNFGSYCC